jgi:hypothetical protein
MAISSGTDICKFGPKLFSAPESGINEPGYFPVRVQSLGISVAWKWKWESVAFPREGWGWGRDVTK